MTSIDIFKKLKEALSIEIEKHNISGQNISVRFKGLSPKEAIGKPDRNDYPILKGKELMIEAIFKGARGQSFTDEFEDADYIIDDLLEIQLHSNQKRASFISGLNAVFRYLELCDKTIHCKDKEPKKCAENLLNSIVLYGKVLLVGFQPGFLESLTREYKVRVVDINPENIGKKVHNTLIEPPEMTDNGIKWCDLILATGSTIVNGTITKFLNQDKPTLFYGVTISAAAKILGLNTYCFCGN